MIYHMFDAQLEVFAGLRPRLLSVAYRMTGSRADAEDLVQEAWLRWQGRPDTVVRDPGAYLVAVVTRLAVDHLRSARVRRERYVGPWLPEPVLDVESWLGPVETVEAREQLALGVLVVLERLSPRQRAVLVLRDGFDYPYEQIAEVLESSAAACRQTHRRARAALRDGRPRLRPTRAAQRELLDRLLAALATGELGELEKVLAAEVVLLADGGGQVSAARRPITGAPAVGRFLAALTRQAPSGIAMHVADVNASPGLVVVIEGSVSHVLAVAGLESVEHIAIVRAPAKLAHIAIGEGSHAPRSSRL